MCPISAAIRPAIDLGPMNGTEPLWVFGYGSLMWRPGFAYRQRAQALLYGSHRALCVYSHVHRGTRERPGLVLGLDSGGSCRGIAFQVEAGERDAVVDYLRAREQVTMVYREVVRPIRLIDGTDRRVAALTYVVDHAHEQYAGVLDRETILRFVRQGTGRSGHNRDYVVNTAEHLHEVGLSDPVLDWLHDIL